MRVVLEPNAILPTRKKESIIIGEKYGMLKVIEEVQSNDKNMKMYLCRCDCGKETVKSTRYLHREELGIRSCGCMAHWANVKHGYSKKGERLYRIWQAMRWRVSDNNNSVNAYRKKNIKCCSEWEDYTTFRSWALKNGYSDGLSLDRIDNSGDYTPNNCRWADSYVQSNNRGNNTLVTVNGETKTISEWAKEKHINYSTLRSRVNRQHLSGEKLFASCESKRDASTGRFIGGYDL